MHFSISEVQKAMKDLYQGRIQTLESRVSSLEHDLQIAGKVIASKDQEIEDLKRMVKLLRAEAIQRGSKKN